MTETPVSLLERLCQSPQDVHWERFVRLFTPILTRWATTFGVPQHDLEDVLQEAFILLIRELPRFRYDPSKSFRAWLWTVFRHRVIAWRQRQTQDLPLSVEVIEAMVSPDDVAEATEQEYRRMITERMLKIVRDEYPTQTWKIFEATTIQQQKVAEVASQYGVTTNMVYLIRSRVLARLRFEFAGF